MTLTLKIPPELNARLEAEAKRRRVSKSRVAREMLDKELSRRPKASPFAHDLAKKFCGVLQGPGDLSTNPKYMEGFGE